MSVRTPSRIEQALRAALSSPNRHEVQKAVGWDDSQVSRFLAGNQGIVIDKIDALLAAVKYVPVNREYLDAISTLGKVGMHCECARQGLGECGNGC